MKQLRSSILRWLEAPQMIKINCFIINVFYRQFMRCDILSPIHPAAHIQLSFSNANQFQKISNFIALPDNHSRFRLCHAMDKIFKFVFEYNSHYDCTCSQFVCQVFSNFYLSLNFFAVGKSGKWIFAAFTKWKYI